MMKIFLSVTFIMDCAFIKFYAVHCIATVYPLGVCLSLFSFLCCNHQYTCIQNRVGGGLQSPGVYDLSNQLVWFPDPVFFLFFFVLFLGRGKVREPDYPVNHKDLSSIHLHELYIIYMQNS